MRRLVRLTGRVVASVLLAGKALAKDFADRLSILLTMRPTYASARIYRLAHGWNGWRANVFDDGTYLFEEEVAVGKYSTHYWR